jgi:EmrB/QacA subfamily drug resistance transporter
MFSLHKVIHGPAHRWWVLAAVECGNFVVYMDGFIVTLALPAMNRDFGVGLREVKWVLLAYLATLTVSLLLAGRLADLWGRRVVTVSGMALLTVGAIGCALAPSVAALIAFRIIQGFGGALVLSNVMAVITAVFPRQERRPAMAVNATVLAVGQIAGLVFGGFLIGALGWRAIFWFVGAVGALGLVLDVAVLRGSIDEPRVPMDWWGAMLSILVIGVPFVVVEQLSSNLQAPIGGAMILMGLILLGLFVLVELRSAHPMLNLQMFRLKTLTCGSVAAACYFVAANACYFLVPLYAQLILGMPPLTAGLLLVPLSLALTGSSQMIGHVGKQWSARLVSTAGLVCTCTAVLGLSLLRPTASLANILIPVTLVGIGGGLFHTLNNISVLSGVPHEHLSAANGFFTMSRNFGQAFGVALAAAILGHRLGSPVAAPLAGGFDADVGSPFVNAYVQSQALAFQVAAVIGLLGAVISALRGDEPASKP